MTEIILHRTNFDDTLYNYYKNSFGMSKEIFDLYANFYILELTASGLSIEDIENDLPGITRDEIQSVLSFYFSGFTGFEKALDINPLMWYNAHNQDDYQMHEWVRGLYPDLEDTICFIVREFVSLELLLDSVVT